jgi:hypothetical protein
MVGLGRVELPTNGLGIGQLFLNLYVFSVFTSVNFVLIWAYSGAERATDLATSAPRLTFNINTHMIARDLRTARKASHSEIGRHQNRSNKPYPAPQAASIAALAAFNVAWVSRAILPFAIKLRILAFSVVVE